MYAQVSTGYRSDRGLKGGGASLAMAFLWVVLAFGLGTLTTWDFKTGAYRNLPAQVQGLDLGAFLLASRMAEAGISPYRPAEMDARRMPAEVRRISAGLGLDNGGRNPPFLYPPTLLYLLRALPGNAASAYKWLMVLNGLALASLVWFGYRWRREGSYAFASAVVALTCLGRGGVGNFWFGQINLLLGVGLLWSIRCLASGRAWVRLVGALLVGLGFWVKLYTLAFTLVQGLGRRSVWIWAMGGTLVIGLLVYLAGPGLMAGWVTYLSADNGRAAFLDAVRSLGYNLDALAEGLHPVPARRATLAIALKAATLVGLGLCGLPVLRSLATKQTQGRVDPEALYLPVAAGLFLLAPLSWDHHLAFYAAPAGLGLAHIWKGGKHWQTVVLAILTGGWLACPRLGLHTHNIVEILADRLTTLMALGIVGWCALMTLYTFRK